MESSGARQYINPGPINDELLTMNGKHRADAVWNGYAKFDVLFARRASVESHYRNIDERIIPYLHLSGFYGVSHIGVMNVNAGMITALVERWRPETHTFHLAIGEATITLEYIQILTGLPVEGRPITGHLNHDYHEMCDRLLGSVPPEEYFTGLKLKMRWLTEQFSQLPADATEYHIQCCVRAWILRCIGGLLCPGKVNNYVQMMWLPLLENLAETGQYSWGSAVLSWLYRELCCATRPDANGLGGYHQLIQMWAWERIPQFQPRFINLVVIDEARPYGYRWRSHLDLRNNNNKNVQQYREELDLQRYDQMVWEPYKNVMHLLPQYCTSGHASWRSVVPLICYNIIQWHQPDRCMRQFGMDQSILEALQKNDEVHSIDLRGHTNQNWETKFATFIFEWHNRHSRVIRGRVLNFSLHPRSQYMQWYVERTKRWITQVGAVMVASVDAVERIFHEGENINFASESILGAVGAYDRTNTDYPRQPVPDPVNIPPLSTPFEDFRVGRRNRRGMAERKTTVPTISIDPRVHQVPPPLHWPFIQEDTSNSFDVPSCHENWPSGGAPFDEARCYDYGAGPSRAAPVDPAAFGAVPYESGPSTFNVDLNVSLFEGDATPYNIYAQSSQMSPQDDFFNVLFSDPTIVGTQGLMDQPLYSDPNPYEMDPETPTQTTTSHSRRY